MTKEGGEDDVTATQEIGGSIRHLVPEGHYTTAQAAELVGKDKDTLKRWRTEGIFTPSKFMMAGELKVHLYTDKDIEAILRLIPTIKPGRKPAK